ncbi:MAG TPA: Uma2 family endonuclease, partial [Pirellulaceae bacterium]|nr:Uma2 family endonuclease [Pirellulaceae bacterium]
PTDVQLSEHDIVQPDLIIVMEERRLIITPAKIKGVPNLIIEILSPSTAANDRSLKKEIYERASVPEYWIVDPDEHVVEQLVMRDGKYELVGSHAVRITVSTIENVSIDLAKVW